MKKISYVRVDVIVISLLLFIVYFLFCFILLFAPNIDFSNNINSLNSSGWATRFYEMMSNKWNEGSFWYQGIGKQKSMILNFLLDRKKASEFHYNIVQQRDPPIEFAKLNTILFQRVINTTLKLNPEKLVANCSVIPAGTL